MRQVPPQELQHLNGGLLPIAVVPLLAIAFGLGIGTGIWAREGYCPSPPTPGCTPEAPQSTPS